jgi:predicted RNase H-like nuclease (RuvC/YqgF family)
VKGKLLIGLGLITVIALSAGVWTLFNENREVEQKYLATRASEDSLRTHFDAALVSIAEIQDSLSVILPSESDVLGVSQDVERGGALTTTRKDQVLRSISDLNESIRRSKDMIQQLEDRLNDKDVQVASLERIVSNLKRTVAEREGTIATLTARVNTLAAEVVTLQANVETGRQQIAQQEVVIEDKRREISTVYYVLGTKKQLKDLGVVKDSGGVVGIGKTTKLTGQFPEQSFANVDTDVVTTIPVPGKEPTVLSGQSSMSYQIVPVGPEMSELRITDPEEFRKVRYLVIKVG